MCRLCLPRRSVLAAPLLMAAGPANVEPRMRLSDPGTLNVALTFDACPGGFDRRVADALVARGIAATIFVTTVWMRRNPEGLAFLLAHRDLFAIENHGAKHVAPVFGSVPIFGQTPAGTLDGVRREVDDGAAAIAQATGSPPKWYRAATGFYAPEALADLRGRGIGIGGYSVSADAGASLPAATVTQRFATAKPGDILLAHINQPARSAGAGVAAGLDALRDRGATLVRLDRLPPDGLVYA